MTCRRGTSKCPIIYFDYLWDYEWLWVISLLPRIHQTLYFCNAEPSPVYISIIQRAETSQELIVVTLHDTDIIAEHINPWVVAVEAHTPINTEFGQKRVVFTAFVHFMVADTIKLL